MGVYEDIVGARCALGMEFGSTRIKAVLIDSTCAPIASGSFDWENHLSDEGYFTYPLEEAEAGMQAAYAALKESVRRQYGVPLRSLASIGISGMMHGYLPFDEGGALLTPFRTWRNTNTARAAHALSEALDCNIPLRWSVAHLYQALLNGEAHTRRIAQLTTLAGYIHRRLTGRHVLGIGEASGMFPVDGRDYAPALLEKADALLRAQGLETPLKALLPPVLLAGETAGALSGEGVSPRTLVGHGGLFKTPLVGQRLMAGALDIPVTVLENAGEGGPWGMALLASYMAARQDGQSLEDYLDRVFAAFDASTQTPDPADRAGFSVFMADYRRALPLAREAGALWQ